MPQNKISFGEIGSCFQIKRTVVVWKHHSFLLSFFFWWGNHGWSLWVSITPVPVITCHWWWILSCNWFHPQSKVGASETRHPKAFGDCRRRAPPAPVEIDRRQPLSILRFARFVCAVLGQSCKWCVQMACASHRAFSGTVFPIRVYFAGAQPSLAVIAATFEGRCCKSFAW